MNPRINKLISRLRKKELSRNRNFELFKTPAARRALKIHLLLQQLGKELQGMARNPSATVALEQHGGYVVLRMDNPELRLRREVHLSDQELSLLLEEPVVAGLLAADSKD